MKRTSFARLALLCSSVAILAPVAVRAQTTRKTTLQEVVVTASRRAQSIQKTSIAVTAISGTTIQQQGETNLQQIIQNIPGVTLTTQQRGFTPTIRGQGTDLPPGSGQGAVATEFDGAYNIRAEGGVVGYYDLARVEVLPGPQGTLYGVNSDGGVVNVISNDPVIGKYHGSASVTIGNYSLFRGEGMVNVPIGDVLAFRVAGAAINRRGYLTPDQGDAVAQSVRTKILYKPNNDLSILIGQQYDHLGGRGSNSSIYQDYQNGDINNASNPWSEGSYTLPYPDGKPSPNASNSEEHEKTNKEWLNGSYTLDDIATLSVLAAYSKVHDYHWLCGAGGPPGSVGVGTCGPNEDPKTLEQVSSEERITSAPGSALIWDVGAYHWNYRSINGGTGGPPAVPVGEQSNAGFGEITYPVLPTLRLIGGVRESFDHKTQGQTAGPTLAANFTHFDYRAGVEWDAAPENMEYFTVSTGYRPGVFNVLSGGGTLPDGTVVPETVQVAPNEQVTSFELGSKNRFFNDQLTLNGDVFFYIQHNYQLLDFYFPTSYINGGETLPCPNGPPQPGAPPSPPACSGPTLSLQAYVLGAEFQGRYNLTPDDSVNFSGAYLDAKFDSSQSGSTCLSAEASAPTGGCYAGGNNAITNAVMFEKINGLTQPHAPAFSGNVSYQHTFDLASGASITAAGQVFFSTGYYVHPIENPYSYQPLYATEGANVSYNSASGDWSVNGYVRNLSNYAVKEAYIPQNIGEPRTFGVVGSYHF